MTIHAMATIRPRIPINPRPRKTYQLKRACWTRVVHRNGRHLTDFCGQANRPPQTPSNAATSPFRAATCVCVRPCRGRGRVGPDRRTGWSVRMDPTGDRTTRPGRPRRGSTSTGPRCYPTPIGDPRRDHLVRREIGRIPSDLQAAIDSIRSASVRRPPSQIVIGLTGYSPSSCSMIVLAETWCL